MADIPVDMQTLDTCVAQASSKYGVHPMVIKTIISVEGGRIGTYSRNSNGTHDMGVMQINTIHEPEIRKALGFTARDLVVDPCKNIMAGTWILWQRMQEVPGKVWLAVGNYHSKTPKHRQRYLKKIELAFNTLVPAYGSANEARAIGRTTDWGRSHGAQPGKVFPSLSSLEAMVSSGSAVSLPTPPRATVAVKPKPRVVTINNKRQVLRFID